MAVWLIPGNQRQNFLKCLTRNGNGNNILGGMTSIFFSVPCARQLKNDPNRNRKCMTSFGNEVFFCLGMTMTFSQALLYMELRGPACLSWRTNHLIKSANLDQGGSKLKWATVYWHIMINTMAQFLWRYLSNWWHVTFVSLWISADGQRCKTISCPEVTR